MGTLSKHVKDVPFTVALLVSFRSLCLSTLFLQLCALLVLSWFYFIVCENYLTSVLSHHKFTCYVSTLKLYVFWSQLKLLNEELNCGSVTNLSCDISKGLINSP